MKLAWATALCLACACATTSQIQRTAQASQEREVKCHLIGAFNELNLFEPRAVLDETKTPGPSKVVWLNPPQGSVIKTQEGDVYQCDATL